MLRVYSFNETGIMESERDKIVDSWIHLIDPTEAEVQYVVDRFGIKPNHIRASLDNDENSRIEAGSGQLFILVNLPYKEGKSKFSSYNTLPLGIILTEDILLTVVLMDSEVVNNTLNSEDALITDRITLVHQMLYKMIDMYLKYLKEIEKKSAVIENYINKSLKNEELIKLLNLEHSLVYFSTALRSNQVVLDKIFGALMGQGRTERDELVNRFFRNSDQDGEIIKELIIENNQAIALIDIYTNILSNTMDAFASIISNNLNIVMKFLTIVTISLAIPAIVTSFYGMNIILPFQGEPLAFIWIILLSIILMFAVTMTINRKKF